MDPFANTITRGNVKTLFRVSFPLMFFLFFEVLATFCERIFLSYYSIDAVHASLNAEYLATIFQYPCVAIGMIAQVFVGLFYGKGEHESIGPCIWQFIWFSFLSYTITLPLSFLVSSLYFKNTVIQELGSEYFLVLTLCNFLFPLNAGLSSFYLGRGKSYFVTSIMLLSYVLHFCLSRVFIFGINGIFPPLGVKGAAIAKCLSLAVISCVFFIDFLNKTNRSRYKTHFWKFLPKKFWHYIRPGLVRASGYFIARASWVGITYVLIKKGGDYLNVLTIGGTIITFLVFSGKGMYQGILTIVSNLIGAEKETEIWRLCRSFLIFSSCIAFAFLFPLLFFPEPMIHFFDSSSKEIFKQTFRNINFWIWLYVFAFIIQSCFIAILIALRDLKFQIFCNFFLSPISFILVYFGLGQKGWSADKLWVIALIDNIILLLLCVLRLQQKKWRGNIFSYSDVNPIK